MKTFTRRSFIGGTIVWSTVLLAGCGQAAAPSSSPAASRGTSPSPSSPAASGGTSPAASVAAPAAKPSASAAAAASTAKPAAASGTAASPAPSTKAAAPGTANAVKGAWVALTANQMIWPLAKDAGYFDKYGVNFGLQYIAGSSTVIPAAASNELQFIQVAGTAVVGAQASKVDIIMPAGFINESVFRVMALPSITSIDQLKGKTVGVTKVGNADYYAWQVIAKKQGWTAQDLKFVAARDVPGQVALLDSKNAQAIAVSPPNDVLAQKVGAHMVLDMVQYHLPEQQVGMALTKSYLAQNRATALNVLKASVEAMNRWKKDPAFAKGVIKKYLKENDQAFIDDGYSAYAPLWPQVPYPTKEGLATIIGEVASQNPKAKSVTPDQCVDDSLVKELVDSGFIKSIYGA